MLDGEEGPDRRDWMPTPEQTDKHLRHAAMSSKGEFALTPYALQVMRELHEMAERFEKTNPRAFWHAREQLGVALMTHRVALIEAGRGALGLEDRSTTRAGGEAADSTLATAGSSTA